MSENLVQLAEQFLRLSGELNATRDAMKRLLLNGAGDAPHSHPTLARSKPGMSHPNAKVAKAAEERIVELLKTRGALRMTDIMAAMESRQSTTSERLRRLRARGLVAPVDGAWTATA